MLRQTLVAAVKLVASMFRHPNSKHEIRFYRDGHVDVIAFTTKKPPP